MQLLMFSVDIGCALISAQNYNATAKSAVVPPNFSNIGAGLLIESLHHCTVQIRNVNIHFKKTCLSEEISVTAFMKDCFHINHTPTVANNRGSIGQFNNAKSK